MSKFDVLFCDCGTVHFIDKDFQESVWFTKGEKPTGKQIVHVCMNCGGSRILGLDDMGYDPDFDSQCYDRYSYDLKNHGKVNENHQYEVDPDKQVVVLSKGVRLMMQSGGFADWKWNGYYIDGDGLEKQTGTKSLHNIGGLGSWDMRGAQHEYHVKDVRALNVNMNWLLKEITPEQAESMCGYAINSLNWVGTPYEKPFHKTA